MSALYFLWTGSTIRVGTGIYRYEIPLIAKRACQIDQNVERLGFVIRRARGQSGFFARSLSCVQYLICFLEEFVGAVSHLVLPPSRRERNGNLLTLPLHFNRTEASQNRLDLLQGTFREKD